jgi:hypothetical protein
MYYIGLREMADTNEDFFQSDGTSAGNYERHDLSFFYRFASPFALSRLSGLGSNLDLYIEMKKTETGSPVLSFG